jgi:formylglycine-generating enzyme required for sulfatase activity
MPRYILTDTGKLFINALCKAWLALDRAANAKMLEQWPDDSTCPRRAGLAKVFKGLKDEIEMIPNLREEFAKLISGHTLHYQWHRGQESPGEPEAYTTLANLLFKVQQETALPKLNERFAISIERAGLPCEHLNSYSGACKNTFDLVPGSDIRADRQFVSSELARAETSISAFDATFVNLSMVMPLGREGGNSSSSEYFHTLAKVLESTSDFPVIVLLGAPGAGKTTLLQKQYIESARLFLTRKSAHMPFYASLAGFNVNANSTSGPDQWLNARFSSRSKAFDLRSITDYIDEGRCLLLLDALNEIPIGDSLQKRIAQWSEFIRAHYHPPNGSRIIVSCRRLDYFVPFNVEELHIPQISVASMEPTAIKNFLDRNCRDFADHIWQQMHSEPELLKFYETPLYLRMLVDSTYEIGDIPGGRSRLFITYLWKLLRREYVKNPSAFGSGLLSQSDMILLSQPTTVSRPPKGELIDLLSSLAFRMIDIKSERGKTYLTEISFDEAMRLIELEGAVNSEQILTVALATHLMRKNPVNDTIGFYHHLIQEAFAALQMLREFDAGKWKAKWLADDVETVGHLGPHDQLGPLPGSGWEETTIVAAGLHDNQDDFVNSVFRMNVALAGRCSSSSEVKLSSKLHREIQKELFLRMRDQNADLRARIQAGLEIDDFGRFGYTLISGQGQFLIPPLVQVPFDEATEQTSEYARTLVAAYPVTNAEYRLFINGGGYEDERWWKGPEAKRWFSGKSSLEGMEWQERQNRIKWVGWGEQYIREKIGEYWTTESAERMIRGIHDVNAFERQCRDKFQHSSKIITPLEWFNADFNRLSQPVVGISWIEAMAYCEWLSCVSGMRFTLMSEAVYERAAGGINGRRYAYGDDFRSELCNVYASHIWKPTPIGLFNNATPEGAFDLTGNVWTWVNTPLELGDVRMVTKGGSYDTPQDKCKSTSRDGNHPGYRDRYDGFRLARIIS